ncbi:hypothetical protein [Zoogloea sp. LCSB751]|uniref:hypothetical protein n=1 Tax=Zoogloea sp. LCSB751 TaxID=1965277 RepID=UPI0009A4849C|nr:hypothetical protein [Zoogloea sp. LCSB751]
MAAPWSTLFSAIPWSDVIAHAPTVAKGARKLWQKVGKHHEDATTAPVAPEAAAADPDARFDAIDTRLAELEARQQDSAELLAALAAQNAELVRATEALRRRVLILGAGLGVVAAGLIASFFR